MGFPPIPSLRVALFSSRKHILTLKTHSREWSEGGCAGAMNGTFFYNESINHSKGSSDIEREREGFFISPKAGVTEEWELNSPSDERRGKRRVGEAFSIKVVKLNDRPIQLNDSRRQVRGWSWSVTIQPAWSEILEEFDWMLHWDWCMFCVRMTGDESSQTPWFVKKNLPSVPINLMILKVIHKILTIRTRERAKLSERKAPLAPVVV
jgi:hypothetical protein